MKKLFILFVLVLVSISLSANFKLANYYLLPTIDKEDVNNLAKYDLVIVDYENLFNNPDNLKAIKEKNPEIKILCYFNSMEIFDPMYSDKPFSKKILEYIKEESPEWFLRSASGEQIVFDSRQRMLNMTSYCPEVAGVTYNEFITKTHIKYILDNPIWDGIFEDNLETVEWLIDKHSGIDINKDGVNESKEEIEVAWKKGLKKRLERIKASYPNYLIIGNKTKPLLPGLVDGRMNEFFPDPYLGDGSWVYNMQMIQKKETGSHIILNPRNKKVSKEKLFYLGAISALLVSDQKNMYISVAQNDTYEDYYDIGQMGEPTSGIEKAGNLYFREYENGAVSYDTGTKRGYIKTPKIEKSFLFNK